MKAARSTIFKRGSYYSSSSLRAFSTDDGLINARSAILFDPVHSLKQLVRGKPIKPGHPSHGHILSMYALYKFEHSCYNYNQIGEFSLHLCAGETQESNKNTSPSHSLLVLPDGIFLHSLQESDIPTVYKLLNSQELITETKLGQLRVTCPHIEAKRVERDQSIVILNINNHYFTIPQAEQTIAWFEEELKASSGKGSISYVITKDFENPNDRQSIQIHLFPQRDSFNGILTKQQVSTIVEKSFR